MAPLPEPGFTTYLATLIKRALPSDSSALLSKSALLVSRSQVLPRDGNVDPGVGVTPPTSLPNKAIFALFGLIGVGFVLTGMWFFFWAKNGGFYFRENDWDDYKTTVLRRKRGPNGTTLSGVTATTDLGGGSVVHGQKRSRWGKGKKGKAGVKRYKDFEGSMLSGSAGGSSLGSEMNELKLKTKSKRKEKKTTGTRRGHGEDEEMNASVQEAVRAYRHEKPARVGGINKLPDGSAFDGSTQDGSTAASELLTNREKTPTTTPTKVRKERRDTFTGGTGGIRKVESTGGRGGGFWDRSGTAPKKADADERIQSEARKLQEKGRAAQRRDFSFQTGDDSSAGGEGRSARMQERQERRASRSPTKKIPGSYAESDMGSEISGDTGTKSYHHPIPGLNGGAGGTDYAEERRKKRAGGGGYRRE